MLRQYRSQQERQLSDCLGVSIDEGRGAEVETMLHEPFGPKTCLQSKYNPENSRIRGFIYKNTTHQKDSITQSRIGEDP
jgi:hypothetical protein